MNSLKLIGIAAAMTALAACGGDRDDMNAANADLNATETLPVDNTADMNAGMTNDTTNDMNMVDNTTNTADNTTNSY
jgi:hypothetical protein